MLAGHPSKSEYFGKFEWRQPQAKLACHTAKQQRNDSNNSKTKNGNKSRHDISDRIIVIQVITARVIRVIIRVEVRVLSK